MAYELQPKVAEMMTLFGQDVKVLPRMIEDPKTRLLVANLVVEEALEFAAAMGFVPNTAEDFELTSSGCEPNLVEAADAVGDILVVTYGAANRLGIDATEVFKEVHRSNMTKVWPDGTVHKRESDGKVIKPDTYSPADVAGTLKLMEASALLRLLCYVYPAVSSAIAQGKDPWSWVATEAFGAAGGFTYPMAESSKELKDVGVFARIYLAREAARTIVFFHGYKLSPEKLASVIDCAPEVANGLLTLFEARFPKLTPARPTAEDEAAAAIAAAPVSVLIPAPAAAKVKKVKAKLKPAVVAPAFTIEDETSTGATTEVPAETPKEVPATGAPATETVKPTGLESSDVEQAAA